MKSIYIYLILSALLAILIPPVSIRCAAITASDRSGDNIVSLFEKPSQQGEKMIITGLNPSVLICNIAKENGLSVVRDKQGEGEPQAVRETDSPADSLSMIRDRNLERWGARFTLRKGNYPIGQIQIGVFSDPNVAAEIFADQILYTSAGPNTKLDSELGDQAVGWWVQSQQGFRRILLRRANVCASIGIFFGGDRKMTAPLATTSELAKRLDSALKSGSHAVRHGTVLRVPRIVGVDIPKELISRSKVDAKVRIVVPENPQDPNSKDTEVVRTLPFYVPGVSPDERSEENRTFTYEVTYISPACVVTSKQVKLIVKPSTVHGEEKSN